MKNSNSRDKNLRTQAPVQPQQSTKLMKTDIHQSKRQEIQKTQYNRPASGKKIQSGRNIPPRGPVSKKQFIIQDHMTESRIHEAKQGLQLLKKKMSSKGLSRQKSSNNDNQAQKPITSLKTVSANKIQDNTYENRNANMPPKRNEKVLDNQGYSKKPPILTPSLASTKNAPQNKPTPQNQRKQPSSYNKKYDQQYQDIEMQVPIQPKKDFNAMLQQQLRKEKQKGLGNNSVNSKQARNMNMSNQPSEYPDEGDIQLIECRHCERKFNSNIIDKHQKICIKVFQQKRKAFDSAAFRAPQVQGPPVAQSKKTQPQKVVKKQPSPNIIKKQQDIPKWKAASLAFRANLKQAKGQQMTAEEKKASDIAQGMVQCNYCGRKFNQKAAQRHIPFCQTKSKQLPKMNTTQSKKR